MPSINLLAAFFVATAIFAYMPGPAMLYAAAQTIARGRRAGWLAALGIHVGGYAHVLAAALGLAVLFDVVPTLYVAVKLAGAAYLVWLGLRLILARDAAQDAPDAVAAATAEGRTARRAFRESMLVEVLNPKTAIFYVAFLPQFTDPAAALPIWAQLALLGTFVNVMFSSADVLCVLLADKVTTALRRSAAAGRWVRRAGGSILVALGVNLGLSRA
ncbi:LysE family transporter [Rhodobacterales bacterium HKCCE2091]|nr:LysE family transporter [Rhodobacterales bacterium HKCCE2091]